MKKTVLYLCIMITFFSNKESLYAQTVLNYETWSPNIDCNVLGSGPYINGFVHRTTIGQPVYNNTNHSIDLRATVMSTNILVGTEYRIAYGLKKGYKYKITVNCSRSQVTSTYSNVWLTTNLSNSTNTTSQCSGPQNIQNSGNSLFQFKVIDDNSTNYIINYNTLTTAYDFLTIGAVLPSAG